jgi:hypothetical protein
MAFYVADTHTLIWYLGGSSLLGRLPAARSTRLCVQKAG